MYLRFPGYHSAGPLLVVLARPRALLFESPFPWNSEPVYLIADRFQIVHSGCFWQFGYLKTKNPLQKWILLADSAWGWRDYYESGTQIVCLKIFYWWQYRNGWCVVRTRPQTPSWYQAPIVFGKQVAWYDSLIAIIHIFFWRRRVVLMSASDFSYSVLWTDSPGACQLIPGVWVSHSAV